MPKFTVEGTYRHDRGHEHGESHPMKFAFTVSVERSDEVHKAAEKEIRRMDPEFDSIKTLKATRLPDEEAAKTVVPPPAPEPAEEPALE